MQVLKLPLDGFRSLDAYISRFPGLELPLAPFGSTRPHLPCFATVSKQPFATSGCKEVPARPCKESLRCSLAPLVLKAIPAQPCQAFEAATFGSTNPYLPSLVKHLFSLSKLPWPPLFLQSTTCLPATNAVTMQVGSSSCLPEPPPEPPPNKGVGGIKALAHL